MATGMDFSEEQDFLESNLITADNVRKNCIFALAWF
jgi:hypothetical protein